MLVIAFRVEYKQKKLFFRVCYAFLDKNSVFMEKAIKEKPPTTRIKKHNA